MDATNRCATGRAGPSAWTASVYRTVAVIVVAVVAVGSGAVADAHEPRTIQEPAAREKPHGDGEAAVFAALERDLDLSGAQVRSLVDALDGLDDLEARLRDQLGEEFAGSWLNHETGSLVVAATTAEAAEQARAAGAETRLVSHSERKLDAVKNELDRELPETEERILTNIFSWGVETPDNQVVVTVREGHADAIRRFLAGYGDAVRVVESTDAPTLTSHGNGLPWLDGGMPLSSCSAGFNVRYPNGNRYVLSAGHCYSSGANISSHGQSIGPVVFSMYPLLDYSLIQVTNTSYWKQGPYVWTYPGYLTISGSSNSGVYFPVCKSGRTTKLTCGYITAKHQTVNYYTQGGATYLGTVFFLTRHTACAEPGDSGGANFNFAFRAEGITSGAALTSSGRCLSTVGGQNVSYYFPITNTPFANLLW